MKKILLLGALCAFAVNSAPAAYVAPNVTFAPVMANTTAGAHFGELAANVTLPSGKVLTLNGTLDATHATLIGLSGGNGGSLSGNFVGNATVPGGLHLLIGSGGNLDVVSGGNLTLAAGSLLKGYGNIDLLNANVTFANPTDPIGLPSQPATAGWVASNFIPGSGGTIAEATINQATILEAQLGPGNITAFGANFTSDSSSVFDFSGAAAPVGFGNMTLGGNRVTWNTGGNANLTLPSGTFTVATVANITGPALTGNVGASGLTMANATILGRYAGSTGNIQLLTLGTNLTMSGAGVLDTLGSFAALNAGNLTSGTTPTARLGSGTANASTVLYGNQTWGVLPAPDLSALSASNLTSGTVATARLGSGTANSSTVLYGNQTWGTIAPAGALTGNIGASGLTAANGTVVVRAAGSTGNVELYGLGTGMAFNTSTRTLNATLTFSGNMPGLVYWNGTTTSVNTDLYGDGAGHFIIGGNTPGLIGNVAPSNYTPIQANFTINGLGIFRGPAMHRFENTLSNVTFAGNANSPQIIQENVLEIQNDAPNGASAIVFNSYDSGQAGAVGYANYLSPGTYPDGVFLASNGGKISNYDGSRYGPPMKLYLAQEGYTLMTLDNGGVYIGDPNFSAYPHSNLTINSSSGGVFLNMGVTSANLTNYGIQLNGSYKGIDPYKGFLFLKGGGEEYTVQMDSTAGYYRWFSDTNEVANISTTGLKVTGVGNFTGNLTAGNTLTVGGNITTSGNITTNGGVTNWSISGSNSTAIQLTINGTTKYINFDP